jgi:hypothetical protein
MGKSVMTGPVLLREKSPHLHDRFGLDGKGMSARNAKLENGKNGSNDKAFLQGHGNEGSGQRRSICVEPGANLGQASERTIGGAFQLREHRSQVILALHPNLTLSPSAR